MPIDLGHQSALGRRRERGKFVIMLGAGLALAIINRLFEICTGRKKPKLSARVLSGNAPSRKRPEGAERRNPGYLAHRIWHIPGSPIMSDHAYIEHTGFKSIGRSESEEIKRGKKEEVVCRGPRCRSPTQGWDYPRLFGPMQRRVGLQIWGNSKTGARNEEQEKEKEAESQI